MAPRPAGAHARKPAAKWSADDRELMRADKVLRRVMEEQGPIHPEIDRRGRRADPYEALARAIVGQQLSTQAAAREVAYGPARFEEGGRLDLGQAPRPVRREDAHPGTDTP